MPLQLLLLLPAVSLSWGTVLEHRSAKVFSWNGASEEFYVITNSETSLSRNLEQAKTLTEHCQMQAALPQDCRDQNQLSMEISTH